MTTKYIETLPPESPRETVDVRGKRQQFAEVFVENNKRKLIKGQILREDGDRITVRFKDNSVAAGCVVMTVFRSKFDDWQKKAGQEE